MQRAEFTNGVCPPLRRRSKRAIWPATAQGIPPTWDVFSSSGGARGSFCWQAAPASGHLSVPTRVEALGSAGARVRGCPHPPGAPQRHRLPAGTPSSLRRAATGPHWAATIRWGSQARLQGLGPTRQEEKDAAVCLALALHPNTGSGKHDLLTKTMTNGAFRSKYSTIETEMSAMIRTKNNDRKNKTDHG